MPHHGLDLVDPDEPFTAADYRRAALEALHAIAGRGGVAILVGGTGLYLRAVARGVALEEIGTDVQLRAGLEARLAGEGLHVLVAAAARRGADGGGGDRPGQPAPRGARTRARRAAG